MIRPKGLFCVQRQIILPRNGKEKRSFCRQKVVAFFDNIKKFFAKNRQYCESCAPGRNFLRRLLASSASLFVFIFQEIVTFPLKSKKMCISSFKRRRAISSTSATIVTSVPRAIFAGIQPHRCQSGAILIMLAVFIPVVLLGIRYSHLLLDLRQKYVEDPTASPNDLYKRCAREAALAVAQNWNPGLTLGQQRAGVYKIADAIYNTHPCYRTSPMGEAVPGHIVRGKNDSVTALVPASKQVAYENSTLYYGWFYARRYSTYTTWNPSYAMWLAVDKASDSSKRVSNYDEIDATEKSKGNFVLVHHDIYKFPHPRYTYTDISSYPTASYYSGSTGSTYSYLYYLTPYTVSGSQHANYTLNTNISAYTTPTNYAYSTSYSNSVCTTRTTGNSKDYVEVSVYTGDKIKVKTDNQVAYAQPAQCNVDIVLAIPTNAAACNSSNNDVASESAGSPNYASVTTSATDSTLASTPLYQMGQKCKEFVRDNFYHIRGVTMSLIPYSGKLSLSPDKASSWTVAFPTFNNSSTNLQLMIGACLYATNGLANTALYQSSYNWGNILTACPIMCRAGAENTGYGSNKYYSGFLLYTNNPTDGNSYKFLRMPPNPCYMSYANMLSMRCEKRCTYFLPNPYYMIEPTADLVKIYEMCNALYPIYDPKNTSNFVFAALEWAMHMFQSWTNNPSVSISTGTADSATLSRPSKTTSGRKKAVILLVNKPDWFEPGELTYLGFNNDYSEVPTVLSDKIDFTFDYSNSKTWLDGSSSSGTIQGMNKILQYSSSNVSRNSSTGYYECNGTGTVTLTFPQKCLVKVVAESLDAAATFDWSYYADALNKNIPTTNNWGSVGRAFLMAYKDGTFAIVAQGNENVTAYSSNGVNWYRGYPCPYPVKALTANGSYFVGMCGSGDTIVYSSDGYSWYQPTGTGFGSGAMDDDISWDGSRLFSLTDTSVVYATTTSDGSSGWSNIGSNSRVSDYEQFKYGGGYYVHKGKDSSSSLKITDSITGSTLYTATLPWSRNSAMNYGNSGCWLILTQYGDLLKSTDSSAREWVVLDGSTSNTTSSKLYALSGRTDWCGIVYGQHNNKWVAYSVNGDVAVLTLTGNDVSWNYYANALNNASTSNLRMNGDVSRKIACKGGRCVAVYGNNCAYTDNGSTWYRGYSTPNFSYLTATNSYFVGSSTGNIVYSSDGVTWYQPTGTGYGSGAMDDDLSWNGSYLFSLTDSSTLYTTTDQSGATGWSSNGSSPRISDHEKFRYGSGYYIKQSGSTLRSSSSINFGSYNSYTLSCTNTPNYGNGFWINIGNYGGLYKSSDASATSWSWLDSNSSSSKLYSASGGKTNWSGICYDSTNSRWLAFTSSGDVAVGNSSGTSWSYYADALNKNIPTTNSWGSVGGAFPMAYKDGTFAIVAQGNQNVTAYSSDGVNWYRGYPCPYPVRALTANGSYFVGMRGSGDTIIYSSDGCSWYKPTGTGFYTGAMDDDISWDGSRLFSLTDSSGVYATTTSDGSSGWSNIGSNSRVSDFEQFKYGGGYYVHKGSGSSSSLKITDSITGSTLYTATLPWSRNSAMNYGNSGCWLILTQYGDLLKSTDSSAREWVVLDGSTSNTTSSKLYALSGRTDWCGIVYGQHNNKWVAYSVNGDVAVLTLTGNDVSWNYYANALNNASTSKLKPTWTNAGYPFTMAYKNGRFAVVSQENNGNTAYSDDGVNWYRGYSAPSYVHSLTSNGSYFVGASSGSTVCYSSDGITWYKNTSSTGKPSCYDDILWDGSRFYCRKYDGSNLYSTSDSTGTSGWSSDGTISNRISSYEQLKYGGGYYVRMGPWSSTVLHSSTSINFSSYNTYTIPWSKYKALNYGPGYWIILSGYGDILKSSDASATNWTILDGSSSSNTTSQLYSLSGKSNWCGICYGANIGKWVAYTSSGDVALLTITENNSYVQFPYITSSGTRNTTSSQTIFAGRKEFFIEPDQINEGSANAYRVTINLKNIRLISVEITNRSYSKSGTSISYSSVSVPSRSSVLNFSNSNLTHNSNLVEFGTDLNGSRGYSWYGTYNGTNVWRGNTTTANYLFDKMPYSKNDSYFYFFDNYSSSILKGSGSNSSTYTAVSELYTSEALTRLYFNATENWPNAGIGRATSSGYRYLPLAGFTQPINLVLYNYGVGKGYVSSTTDNYISPSADFNRTVLKQLTTDACTNLKNTYGSNVRVYVVKYRKQANWNALIRSSTTAYANSTTSHSYTEIDNCASTTGGTAYDISTEADLKNTLDTIADNIKSWAGYTKAKNTD